MPYVIKLPGYHHSLPSSPYASGPEGQRSPPSGTLSSEFLNHSGSTKILLLICNAVGVGQQAVRFGPPFLMREDRTISWDQLQQSILSKLYYLMVNSTQTQNLGTPFKIRVVGGSASCSYLSPQDGRPLYHPAVDRALKFCGPGGPPHVKFIIEWEHKVKECLFGNIQEEVVKDAESVRIQQQQHLQQHSCTLDECFQLYTKEEQQLQQGMVKMSLWTLPDILILHLKRFRQVGERRNKLSTLVRFPLAGLDMAPHVVKRSQGARGLGPWPSAWKHPHSPDSCSPPDFLYDLYAVCNHHGGMHGGHYTAYCRNSVDGQWYGYDDSSVDLVPEEEICTRGAYILFYQRRNTIPPWSAGSSVRGSTSSSVSDHWLVRLTGDSKRGSLVSRTSTACPSSVPDSPESPVFLDDPPKAEKGGFDTRPFVRGLQGRSVSMRTPTKTREALSKVLPLRWSFGSKDRQKPAPPRPRAHAQPRPAPGPAPRPGAGAVPGVGPPAALHQGLHRHADDGPDGEGRARTRRPPPAPPPPPPPSAPQRRQPELPGPDARGPAPGQQAQGRRHPAPEDLQKNRPEPGAAAAATPAPQELRPAPRLQLRLHAEEEQEPLGRPRGGPGEEGEEPRGQEGLLSFLKPGFLKKEAQRRPRDGEAGRPGDSAKSGAVRLSLSNGTPGGTAGGRPRQGQRRPGSGGGGGGRAARSWPTAGSPAAPRTSSAAELVQHPQQAGPGAAQDRLPAPQRPRPPRRRPRRGQALRPRHAAAGTLQHHLAGQEEGGARVQLLRKCVRTASPRPIKAIAPAHRAWPARLLPLRLVWVFFF
ncbi:hypothetical protein ANANG_G00030530 [Anguilla anguilla]|uniref:ubiquitinyl hydrolase 1 n=1 Tax=Anguilla anguilla TaxID=7936 RepID=A0A9D3MRQ1_ANGAN|nr:hypothetical protein ANANG_G00030530 [Anguilla anguilla]